MKGQRKEPACFIVGAGSFDGFLTEPQEGDLVQHQKFGRGMVTKVMDEDIAVVEFDDCGVKTLDTGMAPMVKLAQEV